MRRGRVTAFLALLAPAAVWTCTPFHGEDRVESTDGGVTSEAGATSNDGGEDASGQVDPMVNPSCVLAGGTGNNVAIVVIPSAPKPSAAFQVTVDVTNLGVGQSITGAPLAFCTPTGRIGPFNLVGEVASGDSRHFVYLIDAGISSKGVTQAQFEVEPDASISGTRTFNVGP